VVQVSTFSQYVSALCARAGKSADDLAPKIGVLPTELLLMLAGWTTPTKEVIRGLARELDSDVNYLEKLASQVKLK